MDEARVNPTMAWLSPGQRCDAVPQGALMACVTCFDNKEESKSTRKEAKQHMESSRILVELLGITCF